MLTSRSFGKIMKSRDFHLKMFIYQCATFQIQYALPGVHISRICYLPGLARREESSFEREPSNNLFVFQPLSKFLQSWKNLKVSKARL